jgi:hypothetical protein
VVLIPLQLCIGISFALPIKTAYTFSNINKSHNMKTKIKTFATFASLIGVLCLPLLVLFPVKIVGFTWLLFTLAFYPLTKN